MAGGYIEINDTDSIIRGTMAGVNGTFSGTFDSNNIDAISSINVRDGAVSSYYHFHFAKNSSDVSFTVLKQPFTSIVDIVIPVMIEEVGEGNPNGPWGGYSTPVHYGYKPTTVTVYKNGALFSRKEMNPNSGSFTLNVLDYDATLTKQKFYLFVNYISALRIVDFNVESNATYRVVVVNHYGATPYWQDHFSMYAEYENTRFYSKVDIQGQITVGFRKR